MLVPLRLDQHVQDLAFSINSAPEIDHASVDLEIDLIQMLGCVGLRPALAQVSSDQWPKVVHPAPYRLVGDSDAAFGEQILYISKAQGEPKVEPYRLLDDLRRKPVTTVTDFVIHLATGLSRRAQAANAVTMPWRALTPASRLPKSVAYLLMSGFRLALLLLYQP